MDVLWSPWRYDYISGSGSKRPDGCVFCQVLNSPAADDENFILLRADFNVVILNLFPYATGHLLIIPYDHLPDLHSSPQAVTDEMMELTRRSQAALGSVYQPDGYNLGMNLGKAAGAGVAEHIHMHILPRWFGDVNFLTSVGETRTIPEALSVTYQKLVGRI